MEIQQNNQPAQTPIPKPIPSSSKKWYKHKGLITIFILAIITTVVCYFAFKKQLLIDFPSTLLSVNKADLFYPKKDKIIIFHSCTPEDMQGNRGVCVQDGQIYLIDLPSQKTAKITKVKSNKFNPKIFNNYIVWLDDRDKQVGGQDEQVDNTGWHYPDFIGQNVYAYNLDTKKESKISSSGARRAELQIYGDKVAWTEQTGRLTHLNYKNTEVHVYDLKQNKELFADNSVSAKQGLTINQDYLVWSDSRKGADGAITGCDNCAENKFDIFAYDFNANSEKVLIESPYLKSNPSLSGNQLVWEDYRNGAPTVYSMDLNTKIEKPLDSSWGGYPQIVGNKVLWVVAYACDVMPQPDNTGVFLYDMITKQTEKLTNFVEPRAKLFDGMVVIQEGCMIGSVEYGISTK